MKSKGGISIAVIICLLFLLAGVIYKHFVVFSAPNVITWDVFGYYSWLIGIFGEGGFFDFKTISHLHQQYDVSGSDLYQVVPLDSGRYVPIYTLGLAILLLPFYLFAWVIATAVPTWPSDGMSLPFQIAILAASITYSYIGLNWLQKLLSKYFSPEVCGFTLLSLVLGTNYFNYTALENGMPHAYLFTLYAGILFFTDKWHRLPSYGNISALASLIALAALVRPTEIIGLLIPIFYGFDSRQALLSKWRLVKKHKFQVIFASVLMLLLASLQTTGWYLLTGKLWYNAYAEFGHKFDFASPHLIEGLFSYRKGWLIYTPLMSFAIFGMYFLRDELSRWRTPLMLFFFLNLYIVLSWHMWWYAGSFGMRALVQSYAVMALLLAAFVNELMSFKFRKFVFVFIALFALLNLFQTWQYLHRIIPPDGINKTFYWLTFGSTQKIPEYRKYLETDERLNNVSYYHRELIAFWEPEIRNPSSEINEEEGAPENNQSLQLKPGQEFGASTEVVLNDSNLANLKGRWLLFEADIMYRGALFNDFNGAKLIASIDRNSESIKWRGVSFQKYLIENKWQKASFEFFVPETIESGDKIKSYIWNTSPDTVLIKNLSIYLLR